ncbi:MAG TPA: hypothetical protein VMP08_13805 [Anaerolineae bacterium]|nr:hypothetical protein [Anaerolineae bacterium]
MFTLLRRCLTLMVAVAMLAACNAATPASTVSPTELPTSTPVPPTATPLLPTLSPSARPGISNLRYAIRQDLTDAQGDGASFDVGTSSVWVAVDYRDLSPNTDLIWRIDGGNIQGSDKKQTLSDTSGTVVFDLFSGGHTALPGKYRVTVRTNRQVLTAAFSISVDRLKPGTLIVSDQFDNNTLGWKLSSTPIGSAKITGGELQLAVKWKQQNISTAAPFGLSDFDLSVDVAHDLGPADGYASIWFRQNYALDIFANGAIFIFQIDDRNAVKLLEAAPEPSFQPNGFTRVRIVADGDSLTFYRNDVLLGAISQATDEAGAIGLSASTLAEGNLLISFDNLEVRVPIDTTTTALR